MVEKNFFLPCTCSSSEDIIVLSSETVVKEHL